MKNVARGSVYAALVLAALVVSSSGDAASLQCHREPNAPFGICFDPEAVTTVNPDLHSVRLIQSDEDRVQVLPITLLRNCRTGLTQVWDGQGVYYPAFDNDATIKAVSTKVCISVVAPKGFVLSETAPKGFVLSE